MCGSFLELRRRDKCCSVGYNSSMSGPRPGILQPAGLWRARRCETLFLEKECLIVNRDVPVSLPCLSSCSVLFQLLFLLNCLSSWMFARAPKECNGRYIMRISRLKRMSIQAIMPGGKERRRGHGNGQAETNIEERETNPERRSRSL